MGFKADTSFLQYVSMGAVGARHVKELLKQSGFEPIELERYCLSNKIWSTKVKRLRLPDLLCVRTGLRVEVRAKSELQIRMSDAPTNPERRWDVGMRDEDLACFIACQDVAGDQVPATEPVFFTYRDLRQAEGASKLGDPKAVSEGTETSRTWPSTVPKRDGVVEWVHGDKLRALLDADEVRNAKYQTFQLNGKTPYVVPGERFVANASIIAGVPAKRADLKTYIKNHYKPLTELDAQNAVDRHAAVKSLPFVTSERKATVLAIEERLSKETEDRVLLEAAASGSTLDSAKGWDQLQKFVSHPERADLRMEAVLILSEITSAKARNMLVQIATDKHFQGDEIRQAAVWGLGKTGHKSYAELVRFLADPDRDVALHAIAAFDSNMPPAVADELIELLLGDDKKVAAAVSEVLRLSNSDNTMKRLIDATQRSDVSIDWILATLGRFPATKVRAALAGSPLLDRIAPLLLLSASDNWVAEDRANVDLRFLSKQNL